MPFSHHEFLRLFDQQSGIKAYILSVLRDANTPVTIDSISKHSKLTRKTIINYVNILQKDVVQHSENKLRLNLTGSGELIVEPQHAQLINDIIWRILADTETYHLGSNILFEKRKRPVALSQHARMSEATLWRKLRMIRKHVTSYQLGIEKRSHRLIGDEIQIRAFMSIQFWNIFRGSKWPFITVPLHECASIVDFLEQFFAVKLNYFARKKTEYAIGTWLHRTRLGYRADMNDTLKQNINNYLFERFVQHYTQFCDQLTTAFPVDTVEIAYLFLSSLAEDYFYQDVHFLEEWLNIHDRQQTQLGASITVVLAHSEQLITNFVERFWSNPHVRAYLASTHLFCQLYKGFCRSSNDDIFWEQRQFNLSNLKKEIAEFIQLLSKQTGFSLFEQQQFLTYRYMSIFSLSHHRTYFEQSIRIWIITDLPKFEQYRLIEGLLDVFNKHFHLVILTDQAVDDYEIDIVISTVSEFPQHGLPKHVRCFTFVKELTFGDYLLLGNAFYSIVKERRSQS